MISAEDEPLAGDADEPAPPSKDVPGGAGGGDIEGGGSGVGGGLDIREECRWREKWENALGEKKKRGLIVQLLALAF